MLKYYFYLVGIVIADVLDRNHPCYCQKWVKRYEPSLGCLNGTRWVINDCSNRLDSSCYVENTMWREECPPWYQRVPNSIDLWSDFSDFDLNTELDMNHKSFSGAGSTTVTTSIHLPNPPLWTEWEQWSTCHAGLTTYLGLQKSEIKSSEECVAGSMFRRRYCWERIYGSWEIADMHRTLPLCNGMTFKYEEIFSINDTVRVISKIDQKNFFSTKA